MGARRRRDGAAREPRLRAEFILGVKYIDDASAKASEREVNDAIAKVGKSDPLVAVLVAALVSVDVDRDDGLLTLKATLHRALLERIARE
jgi:hypothetical protein